MVSANEEAGIRAVARTSSGSILRSRQGTRVHTAAASITPGKIDPDLMRIENKVFSE